MTEWSWARQQSLCSAISVRTGLQCCSAQRIEPSSAGGAPPAPDPVWFPADALDSSPKHAPISPFASQQPQAAKYLFFGAPGKADLCISGRHDRLLMCWAGKGDILFVLQLYLCQIYSTPGNGCCLSSGRGVM